MASPDKGPATLHIPTSQFSSVAVTRYCQIEHALWDLYLCMPVRAKMYQHASPELGFNFRLECLGWRADGVYEGDLMI